MKYYCIVCGCKWRKSQDGKWSLWNLEQKACKLCSSSGHFFRVVRQVP